MYDRVPLDYSKRVFMVAEKYYRNALTYVC